MVAWEYQHLNIAPGEDWFQALRLNGARGWEAWHIEYDRERGWRTLYFKRQTHEAKPEKPFGCSSDCRAPGCGGGCSQ